MHARGFLHRITIRPRPHPVSIGATGRGTVKGVEELRRVEQFAVVAEGGAIHVFDLSHRDSARHTMRHASWIHVDAGNGTLHSEPTLTIIEENPRAVAAAREKDPGDMDGWDFEELANSSIAMQAKSPEDAEDDAQALAAVLGIPVRRGDEPWSYLWEHTS